jgi:hypothetical protein
MVMADRMIIGGITKTDGRRRRLEKMRMHRVD